MLAFYSSLLKPLDFLQPTLPHCHTTKTRHPCRLGSCCCFPSRCLFASIFGFQCSCPGSGGNYRLPSFPHPLGMGSPSQDCPSCQNTNRNAVMAQEYASAHREATRGPLLRPRRGRRSGGPSDGKRSQRTCRISVRSASIISGVCDAQTAHRNRPSLPTPL